MEFQVKCGELDSKIEANTPKDAATKLLKGITKDVQLGDIITCHPTDKAFFDSDTIYFQTMNILREVLSVEDPQHLKIYEEEDSEVETYEEEDSEIGT